jgi:pimeloyl-ACP methyl ester carboxylesterase
MIYERCWSIGISTAFHLFGHSFGGILAFEYLKQEQQTEEVSKCVSLILSSVPTETKIVEDESKRLLQQFHDCPPEEVAVSFSHMHECRKVPTPLALFDAYGQPATIWRGVSAIPTYKAELLPTTGRREFHSSPLLLYKRTVALWRTSVSKGGRSYSVTRNVPYWRAALIMHCWRMNNSMATLFWHFSRTTTYEGEREEFYPPWIVVLQYE